MRNTWLGALGLGLLVGLAAPARADWNNVPPSPPVTAGPGPYDRGPPGAVSPAPCDCAPTVVYSEAPCCRPGLFARLRARIRARRQCSACCDCCPPPRRFHPFARLRARIAARRGACYAPAAPPCDCDP